MTDESDEAVESPDPAEAGPRRPVRSRRRRTTLFIRDLVIIVVLAVVASSLVRAFLVEPFYIPSASMENTLDINDRILVNRLVPNVVPLQRGDVVVFKDPGGWLPQTVPSAPQSPFMTMVNGIFSVVGFATAADDDHLVKRVIGLPGDHVACCNALGQITVNGSPLKEPYAIVPSGHPYSTVEFNVTVPKGELWVMGDNRYDSQDSSRNQNLPGKGFVPVKDVVGRAILITWPVNRWSWLGNYPNTFDGVKDPKK